MNCEGCTRKLAESILQHKNQGLNSQKPSRYTHISNETRKELIVRYTSGEKLIDVSKELKVNYSSAKSILKVFRKERRFRKVPASQRHLYVKGATIQDQHFEENKELLSLGEKLKKGLS